MGARDAATPLLSYPSLAPTGRTGDEILAGMLGMRRTGDLPTWQFSAQGMSTRAIAPTVGVQHSAVAKDLRRAGVSDGHTSPEPEPLDDYRRRTLADAETNSRIVKLTGPPQGHDKTPRGTNPRGSAVSGSAGLR